MKYNVKITQILEGIVEIEGDSPQDALHRAEELYITQGQALPDMEDTKPLHLRVMEPPQKELPAEPRTGPLSREEVEAYLKANGYPYPDKTDCEVFLYAGDKQPLYDEAIRNGYELVDVDRWTHLVDLLKTNISFRAAMMIDYSLWEEEQEVSEVNKAEDLLDTPAGALRSRLSELYANLSKTGKLPENAFGVTAEDITALVDVLQLKSAFELELNGVNPEIPAPEAKVYMCSGSVKREVYDGTFEDCERFCEERNWEYKDDNDFVWSLDLDDLREFEELPENVLTALEKKDIGPLKEFLKTASVIEYKGILFDEWTIEPEYCAIWSEMCEGCSVKYRDQLVDELSEGGIGACSVKGCDVLGADNPEAHHYYVDFKPDLIRVAAREAMERVSFATVSQDKKPSIIDQIQSAASRTSKAPAESHVPKRKEQQTR